MEPRRLLTGLLLPIERKNVENMAEQVGGHPRRLQESVSESPRDDAGCIEEMQRMSGEKLGTAEGVLVLYLSGIHRSLFEKGLRHRGPGGFRLSYASAGSAGGAAGRRPCSSIS